jgi:Mg-chelatase subunit ChlD
MHLQVVYKLAHMTKPNKTAALRAVEVLRPISSTNLWHGLKDGLKVLAEASPNPENVQALFVLTDGRSL